MRDLGTLGGDNSTAWGVNNHGWVVGTSDRPSGGSSAFLWRRGGGLRTIGDWWPQNGTIYHSAARAVNDRGRIGGSVDNLTDWNAAVFYQGRIRTLRHREDGQVEAINEAGVVAGWGRYDSGGLSISKTWPGGGTMLKRGPCYGDHQCWDKAYGINDRKEVVGTSDRGAYLWRRGRTTWLGALPGDAFSRAVGINKRTDIVGASALSGAYDDNGDAVMARAVLWRKGKILDLNALIQPGTGWELEQARAINDRGEIVGAGFPSGRAAAVRHAFLLTPR